MVVLRETRFEDEATQCRCKLRGASARVVHTYVERREKDL